MFILELPNSSPDSQANPPPTSASSGIRFASSGAPISVGYLIRKSHSTKQFRILLLPATSMGISENSTNSWPNDVQMLIDGVVDVIMPYAPVTEERLQVIDYVDCYYFAAAKILSKRQSMKILIDIVEPFMNTDWKIFLALFLTLATVAFVCHVQEQILHPRRQIGFYNYLYQCIAALFTEDFLYLSDVSTVRIQMVFYWFSTFFFTTLLCSFFTTSLVVETPNSVIDSLEDLLEQPDIVPVIINGVSFEDFIQMQSTDEHKRLWEQIQRHNGTVFQNVGFSLYEIGLQAFEKMNDGKYVVIDSEISLIVLCHLFCERAGVHSLHISNNQILSSLFGIEMRKGFDPPWKKRLKKSMEISIESGLLDWWCKKLTHGKSFPKCLMEENSEGQEDIILENRALVRVYNTWACGIGLAFLVFLVELLTKIHTLSAWCPQSKVVSHAHHQ